jgi:hypothetical protein
MPKSPPIYDKTMSIFSNLRLMIFDVADLKKIKIVYVSLIIEYVFFIELTFMIPPV